MAYFGTTGPIQQTKTGRHYFVNDRVDYSNGYIEINDTWSPDYMNPFYEQFPFWWGATFMGITLPKLCMPGNDQAVMMLSVPWRDVNIKGNCQAYDLKRLTNRYLKDNPKLTQRVKLALYKHEYFWTIGFDDNNIEQCGKEHVAQLTKQIAQQMDKVTAPTCAN